MIEFIDAMIRHFRRHKVKYLFAIAATSLATVGYLYYTRDEDAAISRRADKIQRSLADC